MIKKRIIAPLIIVVILSGIGGVFTAKQRTEAQLKKLREAASSSQTNNNHHSEQAPIEDEENSEIYHTHPSNNPL